jgi:hypothetical protein
MLNLRKEYICQMKSERPMAITAIPAIEWTLHINMIYVSISHIPLDNTPGNTSKVLHQDKRQVLFQ